MTWLRRIGVGLGLGFWFLFVFIVTWRLTFPGGALASYARWRFQQATDGTMLLDAKTIVPSVLPPGVYGSDVHLVSKERPRRGQEGEAKELIAFDAVALHISPFTLLSWLGGGGVSLGGTATLRGGDLDFAVDVVRGEKGLRAGSIALTATGFPVSAIPIAADTRLEGKGGFDIDIQLDAADGLSKANGTIEMHAKDVTLERLVGSATGDIDLASIFGGPVLLERFDVVFGVVNGKAKVTTGEAVSDIAEVTVDGDITLRDDLLGSILRLKLIIGLGDKVKANPLLKSGMDSAHWEADDKYHYQISGALRAPKPPRPERERRARAARSPRLPRDGGPELPFPREPFGRPGEPGPEILPPDEAGRAERARSRADLVDERRRALRDRLGPNGEGPQEGPRPPRLPGGEGPPFEDDPLQPGEEEDLPEQDFAPPPLDEQDP